MNFSTFAGKGSISTSRYTVVQFTQLQFVAGVIAKLLKVTVVLRGQSWYLPGVELAELSGLR